MNNNSLSDLKIKLNSYHSPDNQNLNHLIFNFNDHEQLSQALEILDTVKGLTVHDEVESQVKELYKIRNPHKKRTPQELTEAYEAWKVENDPFTYGNWIYYPWNKKFVHLLTEDEFVELRTSRNKYKLTPEEQDELSKKTVGVIGLSVGQSVSVTMAIERTFGKIKIADFDVLELTNLNRIRRGIDSIGLKKTTMVKREIAEIDPFLKVEVFDEGITEENIDEFLLGSDKLDILIEECDSLDIKVLARLKAREYKIPVIMDTSDRGMLDIERFDLEPDRKIFHGLVEEDQLKNLKGLDTEQKIPFILEMVGVDKISKRFKASMLEVEETLTTWPQLSTSVTMGGAMAGDLARRIMLNQLHLSGRFYVDMEDLIADEVKPKPRAIPPKPEAMGLEELNQRIGEYKIKAAPDSLDVGEEVLKDIVDHAAYAPSGGNVQPWLWIYKDRVLYLFHDPVKSHSFLDYAHRGSYIGLGAALENVAQRALKLNFTADISLAINEFPQLIARVEFKNAHSIPVEDHHNHGDFLKMRLTNRKFGDPRVKIKKEYLHELRNIADEERGFHLDIIEDREKIQGLAEIISNMERLRLLHEWGHHDFINEARWTDEEARSTGDGIDLATLDLSLSDKAGLRLLKDDKAIDFLREWDKGRGFKKMTRKAPLASSALGFLYCDEHSPEAVVKGGRIMQRIWLHANFKGIALQPVSPATFMFYRLLDNNNILNDRFLNEFKHNYKEFKKILSLPIGSNDLFLFRLFHAEEPEVKSYRYPLEKVLLIN